MTTPTEPPAVVAEPPHPPVAPTRRIPPPAKLAYTAFVAVLVPYYLKAYGPTNFCYFCDIALLLTAGAVWLESAVLVSAAEVGIFLPQMVWVVDFLATLTGHPLTGMTGYMLDANLPLITRFLSFFHFWLPFFLLWLLTRLGYDRRGFVVWSVLSWVVLAVCYTALPAPPAPPGQEWMPVNVNYVYGFSTTHSQTWMPAPVYALVFASVLQLGIYVPTHLLLARWLPVARTAGQRP